MTALTEMGQRAKDAAAVLAKVSSEQKNKTQLAMVKLLFGVKLCGFWGGYTCFTEYIDILVFYSYNIYQKK